MRESRRTNTEATGRLVERIAVVGPGAVEACFAILIQGRVPMAGPGDDPQKLSVPQRELLLAALPRLSAVAVRTALDALLSGPMDESLSRTAVEIIGTVGGSRDLPRMARLMPRDEHGGLPRASKQTLRTAYAKLLARDRAAFGQIAPLLDGSDDAAIQQALLALADVRDPRALRACFDLARTRPALAQTALALLPRFADSNDVELVAEVDAWLRTAVDAARPEWTRTVYAALAVFDEGEAVPHLIDALDADHVQLRASALAALQKVAESTFAADPALWQTWFDEQQSWFLEGRRSDETELLGLDAAQVLAVLRDYSDRRLFRSILATDLLPLLQRPEDDLRALTCRTLGMLGSRAVLSDLVDLLDDPNPSVVDAAHAALEAITGASVPDDPILARERFASDS